MPGATDRPACATMSPNIRRASGAVLRLVSDLLPSVGDVPELTWVVRNTVVDAERHIGRLKAAGDEIGAVALREPCRAKAVVCLLRRQRQPRRGVGDLRRARVIVRPNGPDSQAVD